VLLVGMPTMLREILRSIVVKAPGVDAVAELANHDLRSPQVWESKAELVIVAAEDTAEDDVIALLQRCRPRSLLAVHSDGTSGVFYVMTPHRTRIDRLSRDAVTEAILRTVSGTQSSSTTNGV
jgi:hypothetical protein